MRREQIFFDMEAWVTTPDLNGVTPDTVPVSQTPESGQRVSVNGNHEVAVENLRETTVVVELPTTSVDTGFFNPQGDSS